MTREKQKTDIAFLGRAWRERLKDIRAMAKRSQKTDIECSGEAQALDDAIEIPSGSELFTGPVYEELSTQQVFAGDEDFYKTLEDARTAGAPQSFDAGQILTAPTKYKRFSFVQKSFKTLLSMN